MPGDGGGGTGRPDPAAVAAALAEVPGVVTAWTTCDADGVPVAVRIVLEPGADEVDVAARAHRILRLQFGLGLDPAHVQVLDGPDPRPGIPSPRLHLVEEEIGRVIELGARAGPLHSGRGAEDGRFPADVLQSAVRHPAGAAPAQAGGGGAAGDLARGPSRLAISQLDVQADGSMTAATVTLRGTGTVHVGTAEGWSAATTVDRTIAQATANAVESALGPTGHLEVEVASVVPVGALEVVVVQVAWVTPGTSERLLGAAEVGDDVRTTVIRATLDAVNRRLARLDPLMPAMDLPRTLDDLLADLPTPWPREDVVLGNGTFSVRSAPPAGGGPHEPALFVHGLGGNSTNWTDLMALLRGRVDGIAVDLPGFGWSPPPRDGDFTPRRNAESLAELVEKRFEGRPVHLFGNSMGGSISVQLAARRPDLVRTLTLVSPALPKVGVRRTNVHLPVIAAPGLGTTLMKRYLTLDAATRARATIDICFADPASVPPARMEEAVDEVRRRDALPYVSDAFVQSLRALMATYLDRGPERPWKLAEGITCPTLLVYGRRDKLVDPIHAHTKAFPDVRVLVLPHAGHVSQIEQPVLVADAWQSLLAVTTDA